MHRVPLLSASGRWTTAHRVVSDATLLRSNVVWKRLSRTYTSDTGIQEREKDRPSPGQEPEGISGVHSTTPDSTISPPTLAGSAAPSTNSPFTSMSPINIVTRWNTESRKLMNLQRLAQLQTKLHEQNSMLPASHSDLEAKIAKQQVLVDQLAELKKIHAPEAASHQTPAQSPLPQENSPFKQRRNPRPFSPPRQQPKPPQSPRAPPSHEFPQSPQSRQFSPTPRSPPSPLLPRQQRQSRQPQKSQPRRPDDPERESEQLEHSRQLHLEQPKSLLQHQPPSRHIDNYEQHIFQLVGDAHTLCEVGPAYLEMVARSVRPTNAEFYSKVIDALLSPAVQDTPLALRALDDAKSLGLATQAMYCAVLRSASVNHPEVVRIASDLQNIREELTDTTSALLKEFLEHRALAQLHIYSTYSKGSDAQWRKLADYVVPRSTAAELDQEFRILLFMMEAAGDFSGCRAVFQYLIEKGIAFPDVNVCEYLLTSAVRAKDVKFAEWLLHVIAARLGVTESMYSRVAHLQCHLKDFAGSIKTFASIRSKGLTASSDSLRTQLTALAQIGDLKGFAEESATLKEQQSNLFTLTSLKLLSVLSKRGSYPDLARLLALTESLLRPDFRYYATMLHIAAHIDDHERFYSLLGEMRSAGIVPHISVFSELLSSMQRTGRVELDRLLDTIRAHGLVPDSNLLSQLAQLQGTPDTQTTGNSPPPSTRSQRGSAQNAADSRNISSVPRQSSTAERDMKAEVFAILRSAEKIGVWNALNEVDKRKAVDLPFYNSLLEAYSRKENLAACREILRKMDSKGIQPNATSYNMIVAATKSPRVDDYRRLLEEMKAKGVAPNERTYNGFLSLLSKRRHWTDFDRVLEEMRVAGVAPNISTHSILLNSAALRGDLQACQQAAEALRKIGPLGPSAYTSLIIAACASGSIDQANQYLAEMTENKINPEVHAFNKIMQVCEKRGAAKECWRLLDEMIRLGVKRNMDSYATVVRTVLNQVGNDDKDMPDILWDFSKWVLNDMKAQGVKPEMAVFGAIADYMAKMGELARFNEVREWMREHNLTPDPHTLSTLVKQLAAKQDYERARSVLKEMWGAKMKPTGVAYATLLNALVDAEMWSDSESVIRELSEFETADVVALCEKIVEAGKQGDTLERAKVTALLQPTNKTVL